MEAAAESCPQSTRGQEKRSPRNCSPRREASVPGSEHTMTGASTGSKQSRREESLVRSGGRARSSMSSRARSTRAGIGRFQRCKNGSPIIIQYISPNKPSGIAWTSSTIHTNQPGRIRYKETEQSKMRLKKGPRSVPGAVERQAVRALFQR